MKKFYGVILVLLIVLLFGCESKERKDADAYYNMGNAYDDKGNYNQSNNELTAEDWFQKGYNAQEIKEYDDAILYYQKAIEIDPDFAKAYYSMGNAYSDKGNYDKAIECYQKTIEIDPEYVVAYYIMGLTYDIKDNYDKSIECYQKAIEIDPDYAKAYNHMGDAYYSKDNYDKSIECYQKAIEIEPDYVVAYYKMGNAYYLKGWETSAADNFYQAGIIYLKQYNNRQMVLQIIDMMKDMVPDSPLIQKLESKLYE